MVRIILRLVLKAPWAQTHVEDIGYELLMMVVRL